MKKKYENVSYYIERHSIENSSETFGVSVPTINRWKSKQEFPKSAEIVIEHINYIAEIENDLRESNSILRVLQNKVRKFKDSFSELLK
jgi:hypothetical protein